MPFQVNVMPSQQLSYSHCVESREEHSVYALYIHPQTVNPRMPARRHFSTPTRATLPARLQPEDLFLQRLDVVSGLGA